MMLNAHWQLLLTIFLTGIYSAATSSLFPDADCMPPLFFTCHNSNKCISHFFVCDGDDDCGDASDENSEQCLKESPSFADECKEDEFQCIDRFLCIPEIDYCDGKKDCIDGSDEVDDCHLNKTCNGFKCKNGQCILKHWACDGMRDCFDGSDEFNCTNRNVIPPAVCNNAIDKYLCKNNKCIDSTLICDNFDNCGDNSDENPADCEQSHHVLWRNASLKSYPDLIVVFILTLIIVLQNFS